jgi:hypothetical protein
MNLRRLTLGVMLVAAAPAMAAEPVMKLVCDWRMTEHCMRGKECEPCGTSTACELKEEVLTIDLHKQTVDGRPASISDVEIRVNYRSGSDSLVETRISRVSGRYLTTVSGSSRAVFSGSCRPAQQKF